MEKPIQVTKYMLAIWNLNFNILSAAWIYQKMLPWMGTYFEPTFLPDCFPSLEADQPSGR
jgi:hypothetical protein